MVRVLLRIICIDTDQVMKGLVVSGSCSGVSAHLRANIIQRTSSLITWTRPRMFLRSSTLSVAVLDVRNLSPRVDDTLLLKGCMLEGISKDSQASEDGITSSILSIHDISNYLEQEFACYFVFV